jgi:hypothetical protein
MAYNLCMLDEHGYTLTRICRCPGTRSLPHARTHKRVRGHTLTHTRACAHTHKHTYAEVQNNYCFSTAIVVCRTRLILRYTYIACFVIFFCFSFVVLLIIFQPFPLFYYVSSLYAPFSVSKISMCHYSLFNHPKGATQRKIFSNCCLNFIKFLFKYFEITLQIFSSLFSRIFHVHDLIFLSQQAPVLLYYALCHPTF